MPVPGQLPCQDYPLVARVLIFPCPGRFGLVPNEFILYNHVGKHYFAALFGLPGMKLAFIRAMVRRVRLFPFLLAFLTFAHSPEVAANVLRLNGMLVVKGKSMDGARVIVVAHDQAPKVITQNLTRFNLTLELQKEYLLSFERPGCMSKQLQFSTKVPDGRVLPGGFDFPFQVTLEPVPAGEHMEYAGPVGYIHYDATVGDFSYSTDYRINKDDILSNRLKEAQKELDEVKPSVAKPDEARKPEAVRKVERTRVARPTTDPKPEVLGPNEQLAPTVRRVAPMVHVLQTPDANEAATPREERAVRVELRPAVVEEPLQTVPGRTSAMEKEVLVDPLRVSTVITHTEDGRKVEYRRVVSYYGSVTFFRNGRPCSADTYYRGIGQPSPR